MSNPHPSDTALTNIYLAHHSAGPVDENPTTRARATMILAVLQKSGTLMTIREIAYALEADGESIAYVLGRYGPLQGKLRRNGNQFMLKRSFSITTTIGAEGIASVSKNVGTVGISRTDFGAKTTS